MYTNKYFTRYLITTLVFLTACSNALTDATAINPILVERYMISKTTQEVEIAQGRPKEVEYFDRDASFDGVYRYYVSDANTELQFDNNKVVQFTAHIHSSDPQAMDTHIENIQAEFGEPPFQSGTEQRWLQTGFEIIIRPADNGYELIVRQEGSK